MESIVIKGISLCLLQGQNIRTNEDFALKIGEIKVWSGNYNYGYNYCGNLYMQQQCSGCHSYMYNIVCLLFILYRNSGIFRTINIFV